MKATFKVPSIPATRSQRMKKYVKGEPQQDVMPIYFVGDTMEDAEYQKKLYTMAFTSHRN